jgi:hypothetical protein
VERISGAKERGLDSGRGVTVERTTQFLIAVVLVTVAPRVGWAECPEEYTPAVCERFASQLAAVCELAATYDGREDAPIDLVVLTLLSWLGEPVTEPLEQALGAVVSPDLAIRRFEMVRLSAEYMGVSDFECPALEDLLTTASQRLDGLEGIRLARDPCAVARLLDSARLWQELLEQMPALECADEARARLPSSD